MTMENNAGFAREVVGIFHTPEDLEAAIDQLLSSGFDRAEISLLAAEQAVQDKLGHRYVKATALADDQTVPRTAYISTGAIGDAEGALIGGLFYVGATLTLGAVVASGGAFAAALAAAAIAGGTGGLIGSLLARGLAIIMRSIFRSRLSMADYCCGCGHGIPSMRLWRS